MKKFLSRLLIIILIIVATVILVACGPTANNKDKWINLADHFKITNDTNSAPIWEKKTHSITGNEYWDGGNYIKVDKATVKTESLPLNTYQILSFELKGIGREENFSKIKFTIEVEEDSNLHFSIGRSNIGVKNLVKGSNNIEIDYEKGMILTEGDILFRISLFDDADIVKWSISNIKVLPIE